MQRQSIASFLRRLRPSRASLAFLCVSVWGCWAIHNATRSGETGYSFAERQALWVVIGAVALTGAASLSASAYRRMLPWLAALAYGALVLVLFMGIRVNGMRGWFAWHGVFFQPSEFAKPVFALVMAWVMCRTETQRASWVRGYGPALALFVAWTLPVALQPDFGSVLVYTMAFVMIYWAFGGPTRHLLVSAAAALPAVVIVLVRHPYVWERIRGFVNPEALARTSGWHILQFRRTLALGGLSGRAWEHGLWSQAYLPLGYSDSIFASTAEKLGFLGVLPLIVLILALIVYGHHHACRDRDRFRAAVVFGITAMLTAQAFIHLSVNLGLMPPTGITLPLVSYDGSSLLSTMIAFGIVEAMVRAARSESTPAVADNPA